MDDTNKDDDVVEPAEIDLKNTPLNDAEEPDDLPPEDDDLILADPLLIKSKLEDDVDSLDDLAELEDAEDDDFAEKDEW